MVEASPQRSAAALLALGLAAGGAEPVADEFDLAEFLCACPDLELAGCLGRGGMGVVYRARQVRLDRDVAVKLMSPELGDDSEFAERFEREAQAMARLQHPGIVAVHDFGEAAGIYYIVMELVDGPNLRQLMHEAIAPQEASEIIGQLCDALAYAHQQGVVHRDIKPENVLLDREGRVRVADFGLAKLQREPTREAATRTRRVLGTPQYMAPEQLRDPGSVDHRSDIFAIGVVFYEMLTGQLPLGRFELPSELARASVGLDAIVLQALESNRERRFQAASEIRAAISDLQASQTQIEARARSGRRWPWAFGGVGLAAAAVLGWQLVGSPDSVSVGANERATADNDAAVQVAEHDVAASKRASVAVPPDPTSQRDRWPATELALLDPSVVGVVGLDWSELRQAPAVAQLGSAALAEFRDDAELDGICKSAIVDETHKILVGVDSEGKPLDIILHADWTLDELEACIRASAKGLRARDGAHPPTWTSEALGAHRKITFQGRDELIFAVGKRGARVAVALGEVSEARLDAMLDGEVSSPELRTRVLDALDLASPLWVYAQPQPGALPLGMTGFFGTLEVWDRASIDAVAEFPNEAAAASAKTLVQSYATIIASLPDLEEPPVVNVEQDGATLRAKASLLVPDLSASGSLRLDGQSSLGVHVDFSQ